MTVSGSSLSKQFTIDDAFEEEKDDSIRVYGSTNLTRTARKSDKYGALSSVPELDVVTSAEDEEQFTCNDSSVDSGSMMAALDPHSAEGRVWWSHPKVQENKRVVICAILLTTVGLVLAITGLWILVSDASNLRGAVFLVVGCLLLLPGLYHLIFVYLAVKGRRGFTFRQLPLFN